MTTCSGVQFQLGLKRRRVQCAALGRRPKNRATKRGHRPKNGTRFAKSLSASVSCFFPVLAACAGLRLASGRWFSFLVSACSCLCFGLFSFLFGRRPKDRSFPSFGRGRHVPAPGWERRRVKRTGTDPRTGGGADPRTGFVRYPSTYAFLLYLEAPVLFFVFQFPTLFLRFTTGVMMGIQSILATHDWTFFTPPLSRNAVRAQTLQNGKVPVFRLLPLRVHVSGSGISLQEGTRSWETFADFPGDDIWSCSAFLVRQRIHEPIRQSTDFGKNHVFLRENGPQIPRTTLFVALVGACSPEMYKHVDILGDDFRTRFCIQPLAWFNSDYSSCVNATVTRQCRSSSTVGVKRSRHADLLGSRQSGARCPPPRLYL